MTFRTERNDILQTGRQLLLLQRLSSLVSPHGRGKQPAGKESQEMTNIFRLLNDMTWADNGNSRNFATFQHQPIQTMNLNITLSVALSGLLCYSTLSARDTNSDFTLHTGQAITFACDTTKEADVLKTALGMASGDLKKVLAATTTIAPTEGDIIIGTYGIDPVLQNADVDLSALKGKHEAFLMTVSPNGKLVIAGSDAHGTAYGVLELSRKLGVSPWEWWADVAPRAKTTFTLSKDFHDYQAPSVPFRGIFINDEDWGLLPWSGLHYESKNNMGTIGPKTNARIFELLLRLRANTYWPAMHEVTKPFFLTKGNREVAKKYGIYVGGSHCEPMASSTAGEWPRRGKGEYDYVHNSKNVYQFWENRVKEVAGQDILYTIGMRGVHDGAMNGAKTIDEQRNVLTQVFKDQRGLLAKYVNPDITKVPQIFVPYKEVEDVYNSGLHVPEDVCLVWCDDNYGYIRHFPSAAERARKGGNGVYYHVSYWGRPHDHLWLGTTSPYLLYQQMKEAYDRGIQHFWMLNVGDIKPIEYQIELFMDMAWNINKVAETGVTNHLHHFLTREFGTPVSDKILPAMIEHYRLSYIRKPEFMGNTREEEGNPAWRIVKDLPWSANYIQKRLASYDRVASTAAEAGKSIPTDRQDAYYQLVAYPLLAANQMNKKLLYAQLARHGKADWKKSDAAFDSIAALTATYNVGIHNNGKWHRIMDMQPRRLVVFEPVDRSVATTPMVEDRPILFQWNGAECNAGKPILYEGLGYEGKAAGISQNKALTFTFGPVDKDSVEVEIRLVPTHPIIAKGHLRFILSLDGSKPQELSYETVGRSEEWKENVLNNIAVRRVKLPLNSKKSHKLSIKAVDEGVILDQILIY